jgi:hypothetical protein
MDGGIRLFLFFAVLGIEFKASIKCSTTLATSPDLLPDLTLTLPGLASNHGPPYLCLWNSWDYTDVPFFFFFFW